MTISRNLFKGRIDFQSKQGAFCNSVSLLSKIFLNILFVRACLQSDRVTRLVLTSASSDIRLGKMIRIALFCTASSS